MPVHLDHNATTALDARAGAAMMPYRAKYHGKSSSAHRYGRAPRAAIDRARQQVADLVNTYPGQVIFSNNGTQAGNFAINGVAAPAAQLHRWRRVVGRAVG